jgi:hypothetical protein
VKESRASPPGRETKPDGSSNNGEATARPLWLTYLIEKIESPEAKELAKAKEPVQVPSRRPRSHEGD